MAGMMISTAVASALVKVVCEKLGSRLFKEIGLMWGVDKDLKSLESTISTIKDGLEDAEDYYTKNRQLCNWLRKLKDVIYDADDLLDELYTEAQMHKVSEGGQTSRMKNKFLSTNIFKRNKIGKQIKSINERLNAIAAEREKFHLPCMVVQYKEIYTKNRVTWSKIDQDVIYGRDHEKDLLISELVKDGCENVSVISIIGLAGIGKTTLAQLAYNNDKIMRHFNLRIWIYVSQNFDVESIVRSMIESVSYEKCDLQNFDSLGEVIIRNMSGKRFLLVLDDVWKNENDEEWGKLKSVLHIGAPGSKIIVTTRIEQVAKEMGSSFQLNLRGLSEDTSWILFKKLALNDCVDELGSEVLEIAKDIVQKCGGVPLALRALGSIMQFKTGRSELLAVRDSDIWKLEEEDGNRVIASLRLSYMHFPLELKQCFTYCSVFPKGHKIIKTHLIGQWIAHGFISFPGNTEDKGNKYFNDLVQMSFLQDLDELGNGEVTCKMHDLVHDLARSIADHELAIVNDKEGPTIIDDSCRYLSLIKCTEKTKEIVLKKIRSLHAYGGSFVLIADIISKTTSLRSLVLDCSELNTLPIHTTKLMHLRYLYIKRANIIILPDAIGTVWNLQELHLEDCWNVTELPESVGRLVNLKTLSLKNCKLMRSLPRSVGRLVNLKTLSLNYCKLMKSLPESIGQLENIQYLLIQSCGIRKLPACIFQRLHSVKKIMICCSDLDELPNSIEHMENLECLDLSYCIGIKHIPESISNLSNLRVLNLKCIGLFTFPLSICNLSNLETLDINILDLTEFPVILCRLKKLKYLNFHGSISGECTIVGMPVGIGQLVNLKRIEFFVISKKTEHASISELANLNSLGGKFKILNLENLNSPIEAARANLKKKLKLESLVFSWSYNNHEQSMAMPVLEALVPPSGLKSLEIYRYPAKLYPSWMHSSSFPHLTSLTFSFCHELPQLVNLAPHLRKLHLNDIEHVIRITGHFPSLVELSLEGMSNLEEVETMTLVVCEEMRACNTYKPSLPNLYKLKISGCPKLRMRPCLPPTIDELSIDKSNAELLDVEAPNTSSSTSFSIKKLIIENMAKSTEWALLKHLSSLRELRFECCEMDCLPESMRHLTSLRELIISYCRGLYMLPEWIAEFHLLYSLGICGTDLARLPSGIKDLALQNLIIVSCSNLEKRCEREKGEDWHLIAHIPFCYSF